MRNLVTGGSGFLGGHLVKTLVESGQEVRVLVRPTSDVSHLNNLGVERLTGDLLDSRSIRTAMEGVERVYHCAALATDWGTWEAYNAANVTGLHNLLDRAKEVHLDKFVHISTTDVYGFPDYPADENTPYRFRGWPYGDTKIEGEKYVVAPKRPYLISTFMIRIDKNGRLSCLPPQPQFE